MMNKTLVTGSAGFIGFHVSKQLLELGIEVVGIDNMNTYYDVTLKEDRLKQLEGSNNYQFHKMDISDKKAVSELFVTEKFDVVMNLAAQAGVRYSLENPDTYITSNIVGFFNILECCRYNNIKHLIYASSSSVYGANTKMPFSEHHTVAHPASLYAATKKANELMAHTYSSLYSIPCTGLRFFTVYGPWGRPDMALFLFTKAIMEDKPIQVFNYGDMKRDFTYIDDIVEGVIKVAEKIPEPNQNWQSENPDPATSYAPYRIYNIGNNNPEKLETVITLLEEFLGKKAKKDLLPIQPGDVYATYADVDSLTNDVGFKPSTPIKTGIKKFIDWYKWYYKIS